MKFKKGFVALATLGILGLVAGCGGNPSGSTGTDPAQSNNTASEAKGDPAEATPGKLILGTNTEPTSTNPADAQEGGQMMFFQSVYDTLLLRQPDGELAPMLATEWQYNDDMTVLTLKLRDDVKFIDGSDFNADVVKANMDYFKTAGGPQAATVENVTDVKVVDPTTVEITLDGPNPAFLIYLSNAAGMMASPNAIGSEEIKTVPQGSGPYILDRAKTQAGSVWTYTKNPDYWNPDLQKYDEIDIQILSDDVARFNALVSGQVDWASVNAKQAKSAEDAGLVAASQAVDWFGIFISDRKGSVVPALNDVRVRQAINYAIDGDSILQNIALGYGEPTTQIFAPSTTAYVESLNDMYPYDPEKAKQLMAEAGYADGFELTMPTATGFFDPAMISVVQDQLAAIGIKTTIVEMPVSDYVAAVLTGDYPVFIMQLFRPSTWATIQQAISPTSVWNPGGYEDPVVTDLIAKIRTAKDADEETTYAQELNTYIVEQAWFAPWFEKQEISFYWPDRVQVVPQAEQVQPSIYNFTPVSK